MPTSPPPRCHVPGRGADAGCPARRLNVSPEASFDGKRVSWSGDSWHRHVFVGGLHRSGTSLVTKCIAAHYDTSSFEGTGVYEDEGQFLQTVFEPAGSYGGPGRFAFDPKARLTEDSLLVTEANRRQLCDEWARYWRLDKQVLVEKSPPNLLRTRFLQALFPDAVIVVVVRHPIAVAYATQKWSQTSLPALLDHWLAAHRQFAIDQEKLRSLIVVRYEEFIRDPQPIVDQIYARAGLKPHPVDTKVNADGNRRYFTRWRQNWPPAWLLRRERLTRAFETDVRGFGYSLRKLDWLGTWPQDWS